MLFQRFFNGFFALLLKCSCFLLLPWGCVLLHSSTRFCTSEAYVFWSFAKFQKAQLVSSLHVAIFRNHLSDLSDLWFSKHGLCLDTSEDPLRDGVNSTHEKRPVGNRRSDGIRSKTNRTMIVWSRLVKASVSNGERGFARSVPGQGSWRAFWLGIAVKRKHCKDFGVWVYAICWVWQVLLWSFRSIRVLCMLGFGV